MAIYNPRSSNSQKQTHTMLKPLSENLNILMSKARLSASELARQIGIPAATIKRIRNNEQANPTITTLLPIAKYFSISLNELIGDKTYDVIDKDCETNKLNTIPQLSWHECIHSTLLDYKKIPEKILTERTVSKSAYALKVEDHNQDFFTKDNILIIEPEIKPKTGDYVIVANIKKNITSIRKYLIEIDQIYLKPLVPGLEVSILTPEYNILGVIIQCKMELK